jgi:hypothetical protein
VPYSKWYVVATWFGEIVPLSVADVLVTWVAGLVVTTGAAAWTVPAATHTVAAAARPAKSFGRSNTRCLTQRFLAGARLSRIPDLLAESRLRLPKSGASYARGSMLKFYPREMTVISCQPSAAAPEPLQPSAAAPEPLQPSAAAPEPLQPSAAAPDPLRESELVS